MLVRGGGFGDRGDWARPLDPPLRTTPSREQNNVQGIVALRSQRSHTVSRREAPSGQTSSIGRFSTKCRSRVRERGRNLELLHARKCCTMTFNAKTCVHAYEACGRISRTSIYAHRGCSTVSGSIFCLNITVFHNFSVRRAIQRFRDRAPPPHEAPKVRPLIFGAMGFDAG